VIAAAPSNVIDKLVNVLPIKLKSAPLAEASAKVTVAAVCTVPTSPNDNSPVVVASLATETDVDAIVPAADTVAPAAALNVESEPTVKLNADKSPFVVIDVPASSVITPRSLVVKP